MIQINIVTGRKKLAEDLLEKLIDKGYLYSGFIQKNEGWANASDKKIKQESYLLCGITKALLFSKIEEELQIHPTYNETLLFSVPIVNLPHNHQQQLVKLLIPV